MELKLYNTLSAKKEIFTPLNADNVRMYVCGPTVYDHAHIGNARPIIVFDVLYRLLRHVYGAGHVTYARNITDVDDKINARAAEEGVSINEITERTTKQFHGDIAALGVLPPDVEPRATDHIEQMKMLIEQLVEKGNAYVAEGHVLFDVPSMPEYGKLSKRSLDEMEAGARVEVAPYKKDPMDFVLWKPSKTGEPAWDSPCGIEQKGRPGWHIECSAMSAQHLGETFDIHGGGVDLVFPHHENEIAQSRCGFDTGLMAQVWMHNGYLQVEGEKMSKSAGNFITIHELLDEWGGSVLRFNMLKTHYRQPIDWTNASLKESGRELSRWSDFIGAAYSGTNDPPEALINTLMDDINTPSTITLLRKLYKNKNTDALAFGINFMGISLAQDSLQGRRHKRLYAESEVYEVSSGTSEVYSGPSKSEVEPLIEVRNAAREAKNFAEADRIRDELAEMGVALKDGPEGTTWEISR